MPTTTNLSTLKINYLTQAQYDTALANGQISDDELYFTPNEPNVTINLNGTDVTSPSFYAPLTAGTSGQYLKSNGSGAPTWGQVDYAVTAGSANAVAWGNVTGKPDSYYSLPLAATGTRGGVKIGYTTSGKNYAVQLNNEQMYVNVPWTDTWVALSTSTAGYVAKAPNDTSKYLRGDGTWATVTIPTLDSLGIGNVKNYDQSKAIKGITRSGTTFTYTCLDGTTGSFTQQDNNTTYTFANGTNGFTVTPSGGSAQTVTVTPSITNNVTGSGTSGYLTKFTGANTIGNGPQIGTGTTTFLRNDGSWATPSYATTAAFATTATRASGANITTTSGGVAYYSSTTGTFANDADLTWDATNNSLHVIHAKDTAGEFRTTYSTTVDMWLGVGSGNTNHGLYDAKASKWMIVADTSGNVTVNGNASTATTAGYATTASQATHAATANSATTATEATHAATANSATTASQATHAATANSATTASEATHAATANTATTATNATNIYSAASTSKAYVLGTLTASSAMHGTVYNASVYTQGSVLYGAAWNDYAEYRKTKENIQPGRCVIENGDDTLSISTERLQKGAEIVSDTYGFAIGQTEKASTPIAVTGRVLAYTYEPREQFKPGCPVCSGPNGTISLMTEQEARNNPWCIIGTVSAIPQYDTWGENNVKVDGRIWIRIR